MATATRVGAIPIIGNEEPSRDTSRIAGLAERLLAGQPKLQEKPAYKELQLTDLDAATDSPTLHFDALPILGQGKPTAHLLALERRARLRAGDDDFVAARGAPDEPFESYLTQQLGLGKPHWLTSRPGETSRSSLPIQCWTNPGHRSLLRSALEDEQGLILHPYRSDEPAFQLALLLSNAVGRPAKVLGSTPGLSRAVNNKAWFSQIVQTIFGNTYLPPTRTASSLSTATLLARQLASDFDKVVVKLPSSSGGLGNLVFDSEALSGAVGEVRLALRDELIAADWGGEELLVSGWETEVLGSPSVQLWIPPVGRGEPLVEGVFDQIVVGRRGNFVGCRPAQIARHLHQEIVDSGWLLGSLFQRLGYIGRCSFDYLLVGRSVESAKLELLECNGRWGGTSLPMSLVNRVAGNWRDRPFCSRQLPAAGLETLPIEGFLEHFEQDLFNAKTGAGWLILSSLCCPPRRPWIGVIGLAKDINELDEIERRFEEDVPLRLEELRSRNA